MFRNYVIISLFMFYIVTMTSTSAILGIVQQQSSIINGKIAFVSNADGDDEIYTINPDGSNLQQLTINNVLDSHPRWSPDGEQIAYTQNGMLAIMNGDGSSSVVYSETLGTRTLSWSPDGEQIVLEVSGEIYIFEVSTGTLTNLTNSPTVFDASPAWSPDGIQIAFVSSGNNPIPQATAGNPRLDFYIMSSNGSNQVQLAIGNSGIAAPGNLDWFSNSNILYDANSPGEIRIIDTLTGESTIIAQAIDISLRSPRMSPDGNRIVYIQNRQIITANADGTNTNIVPNTGEVLRYLDWQPILVNNSIPISSAGPDQTITDSDDSGSESVMLDGSASTDSDGTITNYSWVENGVEIATGVNPTVDLTVGTHVITLTVTDNGGLAATDDVTVTVLEPSSITSFTLVNADTDTDFYELVDGATVDINDSTINRANFNVRANVSGQVESVVFDLNTVMGYQAEEDVPYSIGTDTSGSIVVGIWIK